MSDLLFSIKIILIILYSLLHFAVCHESVAHNIFNAFAKSRISLIKHTKDISYTELEILVIILLISITVKLNILLFVVFLISTDKYLNQVRYNSFYIGKTTILYVIICISIFFIKI